MPSNTVPDDMWICCHCNDGNLIALTDGKCPTCSHDKSSCCAGPGDPRPNTSAYPNHLIPSPSYLHAHNHHGTYPTSSSPPTDFNDIWICSECSAENLDWVDVCPVCGQGTRNPSHHSSHYGGLKYEARFTSVERGCSEAGAGSPCEGYWECGNCGASNSGLTDWCPECGAGK